MGPHLRRWLVAQSFNRLSPSWGFPAFSSALRQKPGDLCEDPGIISLSPLSLADRHDLPDIRGKWRLEPFRLRTSCLHSHSNRMSFIFWWWLSEALTAGNACHSNGSKKCTFFRRHLIRKHIPDDTNWTSVSNCNCFTISWTWRRLKKKTYFHKIRTDILWALRL